jgi:hypothetical protein
MEQYVRNVKEKVKYFFASETTRRFRVALIYPGL